MSREYRAYASTITGRRYHDICGQQAVIPEVYDTDSYAASQAFGEVIRAAGDDGILYDSLRHAAGRNIVAYIPTAVENVMQADHFEIRVETASRLINVTRLTS